MTIRVGHMINGTRKIIIKIDALLKDEKKKE